MAQPARRGPELRRLPVRQPSRAAGRDPHHERAGGLGPDRGPPATPHATGGEPSVHAVSTASGAVAAGAVAAGAVAAGPTAGASAGRRGRAKTAATADTSATAAATPMPRPIELTNASCAALTIWPPGRPPSCRPTASAAATEPVATWVTAPGTWWLAMRSPSRD